MMVDKEAWWLSSVEEEDIKRALQTTIDLFSDAAADLLKCKNPEDVVDGQKAEQRARRMEILLKRFETDEM